MVKTLAAALLLIAAPAFAGNYVVQCTAPCTAADGTTQPAGTVLNRIVADPSFTPGAGLSLATDTGQAVYAPPVAAPTTITPLAFIRRFTASEQSVLMAANPLWGVQIAAAQVIDTADPTLLASLQAAVAAGALTQARMTQVLDLAQPSP